MVAHAQPLTLGEILDRTIQLYRRNFLVLAGISAPPAGVMVLIFGGAGLLLSSQLPGLGITPGSQPNLQASMMIGLVVIVAMLVGIPLFLVTFAISLSATNYAVFQINRGEKTTIRASYGFGFRHFWRHVGILFLQALMAGVIPYAIFLAIMVIGGILAALLSKTGAGNAFAPLFVILAVLLVLALMVTCVWLWLRFSLAFAASVVEDTSSWPSLQRSGKLSKGARGRIFVMFLLVGILSAVITWVLMIPLFVGIAFAMQKSLAGPTPPTMFIITLETAYFSVAFLVRALVMPVYTTSLMLFYYDQRIRQEGFDIEQLMVQAGWSELTPIPAPIPLPQSQFAQPFEPAFASAEPMEADAPIESIAPGEPIAANGAPKEQAFPAATPGHLSPEHEEENGA